MIVQGFRVSEFTGSEVRRFTLYGILPGNLNSKPYTKGSFKARRPVVSMGKALTLQVPTIKRPRGSRTLYSRYLEV